MHPYFTKSTYLKHPLLPSEEGFNADLSIVIPSYKETELIACLDHLFEVKNEDVVTEIIVVINYRAEDTQEIKGFSDEQYLIVQEWCDRHQTDHFLCDNQSNQCLFAK